jgi:hypothetical protein
MDLVESQILSTSHKVEILLCGNWLVLKLEQFSKSVVLVKVIIDSLRLVLIRLARFRVIMSSKDLSDLVEILFLLIRSCIFLLLRLNQLELVGYTVDRLISLEFELDISLHLFHVILHSKWTYRVQILMQ